MIKTNTAWPELEYKFHDASMPVTLLGGTEISGYASLFGVPDKNGDVVMAGAYAASLARLKASEQKVKMLWQHDPNVPIGIWDQVYEDDRGLWVKGRLLTELVKGREAADLVEAGAIDGLSIGYRTVKSEKNAKGQRLLLELDLWEVSLVTFPMLETARVKVKTVDTKDLRTITGLLRAAKDDIARL